MGEVTPTPPPPHSYSRRGGTNSDNYNNSIDHDRGLATMIAIDTQQVRHTGARPHPLPHPATVPHLTHTAPPGNTSPQVFPGNISPIAPRNRVPLGFNYGPPKEEGTGNNSLHSSQSNPECVVGANSVHHFPRAANRQHSYPTLE